MLVSYRKIGKFFSGFFPVHGDIIYPRMRRALVTPPDECVNRIAIALEDSFHASRGEVSDPAKDTEAPGL
jgi:hypothetical protein